MVYVGLRKNTDTDALYIRSSNFELACISSRYIHSYVYIRTSCFKQLAHYYVYHGLDYTIRMHACTYVYSYTEAKMRPIDYSHYHIMSS